MKVYLVTAFSAEPYDSTSWVDSVFDSLEKAQSYINSYKNGMGYSIEIKTWDDTDEEYEGEYGHFLSDYIETKEVL